MFVIFFLFLGYNVFFHVMIISDLDVQLIMLLLDC